MNKPIGTYLIPLAAVLTLTPWISSGQALLLGVVIALIFGNPYVLQIKNLTHHLWLLRLWALALE